MSILDDVKNRKDGVSRLGIALALIVVSIGGMSSLAKAQDDERRGLSAPIEGTWIITVDRVSEGVTFSALQSFTAGGVVVATGTLPPPTLLGSWRRVDQNTYVATLSLFIFDTAGNALGMIKNFETFNLENDSTLKGSGTAVQCDIHGDNCVAVGAPFSPSIMITGKRVIAEGAGASN